MAHNEAFLMKLNIEDLIRITLDYQGKFNNILDDLKKDISDLKIDVSRLKSDFSKHEADIQVSRNVNSRLSKRLVTMKRRFYATEQYSRRDYLEIWGVSASVADNDIESKVLEILEEIDVPIDPTLVEDCNRLPSKGTPKKVIIKACVSYFLSNLCFSPNNSPSKTMKNVSYSSKKLFSLSRY